jgi:hypothetical protein
MKALKYSNNNMGQPPAKRKATKHSSRQNKRNITIKHVTVHSTSENRTPEGKFLVRDQPHPKLITYSYLIRKELFSRNF